MDREELRRIMRGIIVATVTPFDEDYELDLGRMAENTQWWVDNGLVEGRAVIKVASVMGELTRHFRPEFLNRIDDTVLFKPLTRPEIARIVGLMVARLDARLAEQGMHVSLTPSATELIADRGYDPIYGARPLARVLQRELETPLGRAIIRGDVGQGDHIVVDSDGDKLTFRTGASAAA